MNKIAVLLTCFNRKEFTLKCLNNLYLAYNESVKKFQMDVYLTDDGSTDGTSLAVLEEYPKVNILKGNGHLYWAGGMRNSWNTALKNNYDGYILLNDDTFVFEDLISEINKGIDYCFSKYRINGVLVGSTKEKNSNKISYGGSVFVNEFKGTYKKLFPNGSYQDCQLGNANIMFVHKDVVSQIGILSIGYTHGVADYDYTLRASKKNIPILVLPNFSGYCESNNIDKNEILLNFKSIKERRRFLFSPTGLALKDNLYFQKTFFPFRFYLVFIMAYFKVLFPKFYILLIDVIRRKSIKT